MHRAREALRRLGAPLCSRCGRVTSARQSVSDWTQDPPKVIIDVCTACADAQLDKNEQHVADLVKADLAAVDTAQSLERAQMAPSASEYLHGCELMGEDVAEAVRSWKFGYRW